MMRKLIRDLSEESMNKLAASLMGFDINSDINNEVEGGHPLWGWFTFTPLMYASYIGDVDLVRELVNAGANLDLKDETFNYTALMWAAENGYDKVVECLLAAGAYATQQSTKWNEKHDAYSLSKFYPGYSFFGIYQRLLKITGKADFEHTHELLKSHHKFK